MKRVGYGSNSDPFIEAGADVNTGTAYVGVVGDEGNYKEFTALGETVNLAARLAQAARSREVLVAESTRNAARLPEGEKRSIDAKGFPKPIDVTARRYED